MTLDPLLWVAIISAALVCFFSIGTRVLRGFSRHNLKELCEKRNDDELFSEVLRSHDRVALGLDVLVVLATTAFIVAASAWIWIQDNQVPPSSWTTVLAQALVLGLILVFIRVAVPWTASRLFSAHVLYYCWPLFGLLALVASPIVGFAQLLDTVLHRVFGRTAPQMDEESLEEEIRTIVTEGHREGYSRAKRAR